ncbi:nuclear transport factor 2 family protein [Microbacterium sp. zg-Y818]|uniref:nuclear transport factor 2 family protein n=1 Tax=unclassified Microbacterium TaxID=2609290 RepID=UPI00214BEB66|nr:MULTISPECIES: nuclear transport factor 2 family protein [unclassified Microbacterium]MCR2799353.1 nuclear transport factor 2 family protein [Microbacterium sp. zg.Y818]WIM23923.1 nuclear transport factor 2 family protein [Microbacterium sp. zg-Y818]
MPHADDEHVALATLVDRARITDVIARYCRGVDRRDFALVRSCYHDDAIDHHTGFTGPVDEYIEWIRVGLRRFPMTQHLIGQQLIELHGDVARCETYGMASHWSDGGDAAPADLVTGFRYVDRMERRAGRWAIAERYAIRDWTRVDGVLVDRPAEGRRSHPSGADDLYTLAGFPTPLAHGGQA